MKNSTHSFNTIVTLKTLAPFGTIMLPQLTTSYFWGIFDFLYSKIGNLMVWFQFWYICRLLCKKKKCTKGGCSTTSLRATKKKNIAHLSSMRSFSRFSRSREGPWCCIRTHSLFISAKFSRTKRTASETVPSHSRGSLSDSGRSFTLENRWPSNGKRE